MADSNLFVVTGANSPLAVQIIADLGRRYPTDNIIATTRSEVVSAVAELPNVLTRPNIDLSRVGGSQELADTLAEVNFHRLYLVHGAGTFPGPEVLASLTVDKLKHTLEDNLLSFVGALAALSPQMRFHRFGRVLAFTTHTSEAHLPYMGAFDASKLALESLVKTAAHEGAKYGIAANVLAMATLAIPAELTMKPHGDHKSWLTIEDASSISLDILNLSGLVNGNVIHCWRHSDTFFGMSAMERNSLDIAY